MRDPPTGLRLHPPGEATNGDASFCVPVDLGQKRLLFRHWCNPMRIVANTPAKRGSPRTTGARHLIMIECMFIFRHLMCLPKLERIEDILGGAVPHKVPNLGSISA
jgi:hypothetical protein